MVCTTEQDAGGQELSSSVRLESYIVRLVGRPQYNASVTHLGCYAESAASHLCHRFGLQFVFCFKKYQKLPIFHTICLPHGLSTMNQSVQFVFRTVFFDEVGLPCGTPEKICTAQTEQTYTADIWMLAEYLSRGRKKHKQMIVVMCHIL